MKVMYPKADSPLVQLSLRRGFSPQAHLAIGHALRPLRGEGVLIVGSGQSFHNMRGMLSAARRDDAAEAFGDWLRSAMQHVDARDSELAAWAEAPGARHAHPYEDHLIPLMVAAGAASGELAQLDFYGHVLGQADFRLPLRLTALWRLSCPSFSSLKPARGATIPSRDT